MKQLSLQTLLLIFICSAFNVNAQKEKYEDAKSLAFDANVKFKAGEIILADSLIRRSIDIYPTVEVFKYMISLAQLPDIVSSNLLMGKLEDRSLKMPEAKVFAPAKFGVYVLEKSSTFPLETQEKNRVLFNYLRLYYDLNRKYGNRPSIIASLKKLQEPKFLRRKEIIASDFDYEFRNQIEYKLIGAIYEKNYALAFQTVEEMSTINSKETLDFYKMLIYYGEGNFKKSIELTEKFQKSKGRKQAVSYWNFIFNAAMGDQKAIQYYKELDPDSEQYDYKISYFLALFDLANKDYNAAIKKLEASKSAKKYVNDFNLTETIIEDWDFYKTYGDAFSGLKDYNKARDYYNLSLLSYPGYKAATDALSKLEELVVSEAKSDVSAPEFAITSPTPSRGLKVVAKNTNLMVKGTAKDPSGIKEVLVNNVKMYVQTTGEFWGDVPVKAGVNKLLVQGTDGAGNKGEMIFEVEIKTIEPSVEIIAVEKTKGQSYCLLIAAQNYQDVTIPSLNNPISDAIKLKVVLKEEYGFMPDNIISLFNPTTNEIKKQLLEISTKLKPEDNLIIFYAGHGIWVDKEKKGFWLMTDALFSDQSTWLPNKIVLDLIAKIPAHNTLLITDACFSGSVFKTRGVPGNPPANIRALDEKISRIAITSGNDTEVPDESVFMKYLIKALKENKQQYLTAQKMFITEILEAVLTETKTEPRYGTLEMAGHVGGDYIFIKN